MSKKKHNPSEFAKKIAEVIYRKLFTHRTKPITNPKLDRIKRAYMGKRPPPSNMDKAINDAIPHIKDVLADEYNCEITRVTADYYKTPRQDGQGGCCNSKGVEISPPQTEDEAKRFIAGAGGKGKTAGLRMRPANPEDLIWKMDKEHNLKTGIGKTRKNTLQTLRCTNAGRISQEEGAEILQYGKAISALPQREQSAFDVLMKIVSKKNGSP